MRDEIDSVLGERTEITFSDVEKLKYTSAVFKETLRKWSTVPAVRRTLVNKVNINGYDFPENSGIFVI